MWSEFSYVMAGLGPAIPIDRRSACLSGMPDIKPGMTDEKDQVAVPVDNRDKARPCRPAGATA